MFLFNRRALLTLKIDCMRPILLSGLTFTMKVKTLKLKAMMYISDYLNNIRPKKN